MIIDPKQLNDACIAHTNAETNLTEIKANPLSTEAQIIAAQLQEDETGKYFDFLFELDLD